MESHNLDERVFMVGIQKGIYQNPPDALSFAWDKYALFETADILRRDWPKQREFAVDSPYEFSFERIPKRLTVEYWFNKNDVEDHPNGKDIFQVKKGREKIATIAKATQAASHLNGCIDGDTLRLQRTGTMKYTFTLTKSAVFLLRRQWQFNLYPKNFLCSQRFAYQRNLK